MSAAMEAARLTTFIILALGAIGLGLHQIYRHILIPIWRAMKALVQLADAMPVLLAIADEFKPNAGSSLRDAVDRIEASQNTLTQQHVALGERIEALEAT